MRKVRCLLIEDEPLAQDTLAGYIKSVSFLELEGIFSGAMEASQVVRTKEPDLLFLDINLPVISGIRFLDTLSVKPMVIFTTAYPEYAVEGFEANAVDYLVKPFSFERFLKAVNRAVERLEVKQDPKSRISDRAPEGFIMLRADKRLHRVNLSDVHFLEAVGDYVKVNLGDKHLIVHETIKGMLSILLETFFLQVHKSYIIPLHRVIYIEGNQLKIGNLFIPIGAVYKDSLLQKLKGNH
jgi:DNA-binding LytR/AlgR family response regulator